jgi:hypothetical protein
VTNKSLYRGYLLKEQLRAVFETKGHHGRLLLAGWLAWAKRSRLPAFTRLAAAYPRPTPSRDHPVIVRKRYPRTITRTRS